MRIDVGDEKKQWQREQLNMPSLDRPESSAVVDFIEGCYHGIARMRRYAEGFPVPLSLIEIDRYLERFPILIDRDEFDSAIYAIDEVMLDNMQKEKKQDGSS